MRSRDDILSDIARCEREHAAIADYKQPFAWLNTLGHEDWLAEIRILKKELEQVEQQDKSLMQQYVHDALRTESNDFEAITARVSAIKTLRLLHVGIGMATEAAEILDQLKKHIFYGKPLDEERFFSDMGDSSWYERIGCDVLGRELSDMYERNIRELKARFPEKFTEHHALNRDEAAEMRAANQESPRRIKYEGA